MKNYTIIFLLSTMFIQHNIACMENNENPQWMEESWIVVPSEASKRSQQPLPKLPPNDTIKKLYKSIADFDNSECKKIVTENPDIVHVYFHHENFGSNYRVSPLYLAACIKNSYAVKRLLKSGADSNQGTTTGRSPLHVAGNGRIVELLVERGKATVDKEDDDGETPLSVAVLMSFDQRLDVAHYLVKHGANINHQRKKDSRTLLCRAAAGSTERDFATIMFLLDHGASTSIVDHCYQRPISLVARDNYKVLKLFMPSTQNKAEIFKLFTSLLKRDDIGTVEDMITTLLDYEPDLSGMDDYENTLMHKVAAWCKPASIEFLVRHYLLPTTKNKWGETALDLVYESQDQACIQALNNAVFKIFFCTPCYTRGYRNIEAFLKYAFASPYREKFVRGILHLATFARAEIAYTNCLSLLEWGAPVNVQSQTGDFPQHDDKYPFALSWAVKKGAYDLIKLFLHHGATVHEGMLVLSDEVVYSYKIYNMLEKHYQKQQESTQAQGV